jgi:hypothetical protein
MKCWGANQKKRTKKREKARRRRGRLMRERFTRVFLGHARDEDLPNLEQNFPHCWSSRRGAVAVVVDVKQDAEAVGGLVSSADRIHRALRLTVRGTHVCLWIWQDSRLPLSLCEIQEQRNRGSRASSKQDLQQQVRSVRLVPRYEGRRPLRGSPTHKPNEAYHTCRERRRGLLRRTMAEARHDGGLEEEQRQEISATDMD